MKNTKLDKKQFHLGRLKIDSALIDIFNYYSSDIFWNFIAFS